MQSASVGHSFNKKKKSSSSDEAAPSTESNVAAISQRGHATGSEKPFV